MQLSAELFEWILSTIGPVAGDGDGKPEKRRAQRVPLRGRVEAFVLRGDDGVEGPLNVRVTDVSTGGMRCELPEAAERGTRMVLRLARAGDEPVMLLSRVAHIAEGARGWQAAGLQFLRAVDAHHTDGDHARPLAGAF